MSEWPSVRLDDIADVTVGHVGPMVDEYRPNGVPFLRSQNVRPHLIDWTDMKFIDQDFNFRLGKSLLRPGDVVTVRTGKPGVTAVIPESIPVANCSDLVITRPGPRLDAQWFGYYMNAVAASHVAAHLVGAVQQHFNVGSAKALRVSLPPLRVQRGIAEVLGALDDKIAANTRTVSVALQLAASLVRQSSREGSSVALSELTELVTRGITPQYVEDEESPIVLNQKCVRGERASLGPSRRTAESTLRTDKLLRHGDVLVNSTGQGTLGRVARWTGNGRVTVDSHITLVRFDQSKVNPTFAGFATLPLATAIEALAEGSTGQTELRRAQLLDLTLRLPSMEVQSTVGLRLDELASSVDSLEVESERLAVTRDALLPLLMSGRVTVKDAESVVGEVL